MRMSGKRITFTSSKIDSCWNHLKRLKHVSHHRCSLVFCAIKTIMVKYHAPFGVIYDKLGFWIQWHSGAEVRFVSPVTASGSVKFSPEGYILPEDNILSCISTEVLSSLIYYQNCWNFTIGLISNQTSPKIGPSRCARFVFVVVILCKTL